MAAAVHITSFFVEKGCEGVGAEKGLMNTTPSSYSQGKRASRQKPRKSKMLDLGCVRKGVKRKERSVYRKMSGLAVGEGLRA